MQVNLCKLAHLYKLSFLFPMSEAFVMAETCVWIVSSSSAAAAESIKANNHTFCAGHLAVLIIHGTHSRVTVHLSSCTGDLCVCACVLQRANLSYLAGRQSAVAGKSAEAFRWGEITRGRYFVGFHTPKSH